jgi:hypothetical protein
VRTVSTLAFPSSRPTRPVGSLHPFRLGLSTRKGWPYPSDYRRAFASSHLLYPLGIGWLSSQLSQWPDHPWGLPCSASWRIERFRVTLCPGELMSYRWTDYRTAHPAHIPFWFRPLSRFGLFDFTRFGGVHHVTHSALPLARRPDAASRRRYFSARFAPPRYQGRTVQMRRGG